MPKTTLTGTKNTAKRCQKQRQAVPKTIQAIPKTPPSGAKNDPSAAKNDPSDTKMFKFYEGVALLKFVCFIYNSHLHLFFHK